MCRINLLQIKHRKIFLVVLGCLLSVAIISTLVGVFSGKGGEDEKETVTEASLAIQLKKIQNSDDVAVEDFNLSKANEDGREEAMKTTSVPQTKRSDLTKQKANAFSPTTTTMKSSSTTVKPTAKTPIDVPITDVTDSEASTSMSSRMLEPTSTATFLDPSIIAKSDADEEIPSSTPGSTTGLGNTTTTEVESAWCSTHSGHPCAFPFRWGSYTWNRCVPSAFGPWCATYLHGDHSYSSWGRCDPGNCKAGLM